MKPRSSGTPQLGTPEELAEISRLSRLSRLLDSAVAVPGTSIRVGIDPLIGLIPGFGDAASAILSGYIVLRAARLGVSRTLLTRMLLNIVIDTALGALPVLGDLFDVAWHANDMNIALLEKSISGRRLSPRSSEETGRLFTVFAMTVTFVVVAAFIVLGVVLLIALFRALG